MSKTMEKYISFYYETAGKPEPIKVDPDKTA